MCLNLGYLVAYYILQKEDFLVMEEIEEDPSHGVLRRSVTTYSPEIKVLLLNECKAVASKVSKT